MEIKTFEEVKPYVAYVAHNTNPNAYTNKEWDNTWIDTCASEYVKLVSDTMGVDYDTLLKDLKENSFDLTHEDTRTFKHFIHRFTNNPQPVYAVHVSVDFYYGELNFAEITKGYFRSNLEDLWDGMSLVCNDKAYKEPIPPRKIVCYDNEKEVIVGNAGMVDTLHFCTDINAYDSGFYPALFYTQSKPNNEQTVGCVVNEEGDDYSNTVIIKFFTTEGEAKAYVDEWKHKKLSKSQKCIDEESRIEKTYGNILSLVKRLSKNQITELKDLIEEVYDDKVRDAKLNPLQLCYEYMNSTTEIQYSLIDGELWDWINKYWDIQRYELVEFKNIFEHIMSDYPKDVKWKNIKKIHKPIIKELSDWFQNGYKGFKVDW